MSAPPAPASSTFEPLFAVLGLVATVVYVRAARIHRPGGLRIALVRRRHRADRAVGQLAAGDAGRALPADGPPGTERADGRHRTAAGAARAEPVDVGGRGGALSGDRAGDRGVPAAADAAACGVVRRPLRAGLPVCAAASRLAERRASGAGGRRLPVLGAGGAVEVAGPLARRTRPLPGDRLCRRVVPGPGVHLHPRPVLHGTTPRFRGYAASRRPRIRTSGGSS